MFSWKIKVSSKAKASKKDVWKYWSKESTWPVWDEGLEWCKIDGPFEVGSKGKLKPKGWFATPFVLTKVMINEGFSDLSNMPFTKIIFSHYVKELSHDEIEITHEVKVTGLLAPLLKLTMGRDLKVGLPHTVNNLAKLAEGKR